MAEIIDMSDSISMIVCCRCHEYTANKYLPRKKATPGGQTTTISTHEKGNIEQVKQDIGDDLEAVLDGMVPLCHICGMHFLGDISSEIIVIGMQKFHKECWMTGKPMVEQSERRLTPGLAAKYTPEHLIIRMTTSSTGAKTIFSTLFFILPDKNGELQKIRAGGNNNKSVSFEYLLDPKAYGNPNYDGTNSNRKLTLPCDESGTKAELIGDPMGKKVKLLKANIVTHNEDDHQVFCAVLQCRKFQLVHKFELKVMIVTENQSRQQKMLADLPTATLSLQIIK